jgi:hypothetical protein
VRLDAGESSDVTYAPLSTVDPTTHRVHFVYRSPYEGPAGKRVTHLRGKSVLGWFQRAFEQTKRVNVDPGDWLRGELGCRVYGLSTVFEAAKEKKSWTPTTPQALRKMLEKDLYIEGPGLRFSEHAIRVKTDDDEVDLSYFFFDDDFVREHARRAAFLLHEGWELPAEHGEASYTPARPMKARGPAGQGEGQTYAVFLSFYDHYSMSQPYEACVIPGVRLPELAAYLRATEPEAVVEQKRPGYTAVDTWPRELLLLRSRLAEPGSTLEQGLQACNEYPVDWVGGLSIGTCGLGPVEEARRAFDALLERTDAQERAAEHVEQGVLQVTEHMAQLCTHKGIERWFDRWILFDDRWAGQHPELADGLFAYARYWDVLADSQW